MFDDVLCKLAFDVRLAVTLRRVHRLARVHSDTVIPVVSNEQALSVFGEDDTGVGCGGRSVMIRTDHLTVCERKISGGLIVVKGVDDDCEPG
jgi:hypothetical protein